MTVTFNGPRMRTAIMDVKEVDFSELRSGEVLPFWVTQAIFLCKGDRRAVAR